MKRVHANYCYKNRLSKNNTLVQLYNICVHTLYTLDNQRDKSTKSKCSETRRQDDKSVHSN